MSSETRRRNWLVAMTVVACYICFIDRTAISVAIIPMAEDNGWSPSVQGSVLSAFFFGYFILQAPAGYLADRFGGWWLLGLGVLFWSFFTAITPPAASLGLGVLLVCRFFMGLAEAVTYPAIFSMYAQWISPANRSSTIGLMNSGVTGGSVIAVVLTPLLIAAFSWQFTFYFYGAIGLLWVLLWFGVVPRHPSETPAWEAAGALQQAADLKAFTFSNVFASRAVWAVIAAHACTNWVAFLLLSWFPSYVNQVLGIELADLGPIAVLPFLCSAVASIFGGRLGDALLRRGMGRLHLRKLMQTTAFGGAALSLIFVGYASTLLVAVALFCIASFTLGLVIGGFLSNHMELAPNHSGTLFGVTNTFGSLSGALSVFVSGLVLDMTGSWASVFQLAAAVAVLGIVLYRSLISVEQEF